MCMCTCYDPIVVGTLIHRNCSSRAVDIMVVEVEGVVEGGGVSFALAGNVMLCCIDEEKFFCSYMTWERGFVCGVHFVPFCG